MTPLALLGLSYLAGSIPTSYWVGRWFHGLDLREEGSGNLGATNAFRVYGWRSALSVLAVDVGKGLVPVTVFGRIVEADGTGSFSGWPIVFGAAAVVGHVFSVWVRFRGGKGVATSTGVLIGLVPVAAAWGFGIWILAFATTRIVSVASIATSLALPAVVWADPGSGVPDNGVRWFVSGLALFVVWAHRANIGRLIRGEERRLGSRSRPVASAPTNGSGGTAGRDA